jgi:Xaa-Pro aminopeptidase
MSTNETSQGYTRRELLLKTTVASAGATLAGCTTLADAVPTARRTMDIPDIAGLKPDLMPGSFSTAEIERRWNKCRQWMQKAGFDALLVPSRPEGNADIKWFTESGPDWVVFPQSGQPTAIFRTGAEAEAFASSTRLSIKVTDSRLNRSELMITALKEAGVGNGRIGVGNLSGVVRNDEGGVSHITMTRLSSALPGAKFESAVDLLMRVKLSRGPEEIEVLKLASRVSELGLKAIVETAAPGVPQRDVWFQVFKAMLDASGEAPGRVSIRAGDEGNTANGQPLNEIIQPGQIISEEISSSVLGYNSQVNQAICVGSAPAKWDFAWKSNIELFNELLAWAKPGRSFADYSAFYKQWIDNYSAKHGGEMYFGVVYHTAGALGDGPRMGWGRDDENGDLLIESGMVFTLKPRVPIPGVVKPNCQIGDAILITDSGAERLGRRRLDMITL